MALKLLSSLRRLRVRRLPLLLRPSSPRAGVGSLGLYRRRLGCEVGSRSKDIGCAVNLSALLDVFWARRWRRARSVDRSVGEAHCRAISELG